MMRNMSLHYIGDCGCGCGHHEEKENEYDDLHCLRCRQIDTWFRPCCPFARGGHYRF